MTIRTELNPEAKRGIWVPAWPFLLPGPICSVFALGMLAEGAVRLAVLFIFAAVVNSIMLSLAISMAADGDRWICVPLPGLPKRRARQQKCIDGLEARRMEVLAERDSLPDGHPNRSALESLHDTLTQRIEMEVEDERNRRFVDVSRRANRALDGEG